jgi:hypothetical protein
MRPHPVDAEREGAAIPDQAAAEVETEVLDVLRSLGRRERTAAAQRAVSEPEVGPAANRAEAGLRDDVDEQAAGVVVLGRELVARDVDRLDL